MENDMKSTEQKLEPVHAIITYGDASTPIESRGYSTGLWLLTEDQINGEFRYALNQFMATCQRLSDENMKKD